MSDELTLAVQAARAGLRRAMASGNEYDRAVCWSRLSLALSARFERDGADADLDESIDACREWAALMPPGSEDLAQGLADLGAGLLQRYMAKHRQQDIDEAVTLSELAERTGAPDGYSRPGYLTNLGAAFLFRYEKSGAVADIMAGISKLESALEACSPRDPRRSGISGNLGYARMRLSEHVGSAVDLDSVVAANRRAVRENGAGHPDRAVHLSNLSTALRTRFLRDQRLSDADESVEYARQALAALGPASPRRAFMLNDLGGALHARFMRTGSSADLDEAIDAMRLSVEAAGPANLDYGGYLANFAGFLLTRYQRVWSTPDLDEAIAVCERAVAAAAGRVYYPRVLSYLSKALREKGEQPGADPGLLDEAVRYGRMAVDATPPDRYDRFTYMDELAFVLRTRWHESASARDLDEAIELGRAAIAQAPADFPHRNMAMTDLSGSLQLRGTLNGSDTDLAEARRFAGLALDATPRAHQDRAVYLVHAAASLMVGAAGSKESSRAAKLFIAAAQDRLAKPSTRIVAARGAADLLAAAQPRRAAALLEQAVMLLPEVASRRLLRTDQQFQLRGTAGLAADAAALALAVPRLSSRSQQASRALMLLEHGRGVLLSQALEIRDDLSELRGKRPDLADRYAGLRDLLDQPPGADEATAASGGGTPAPDRHRIAQDFAATVTEIRRLPGFARFMLPPEPGELVRTAAPGGTVIFNVSEYRSDALLVHFRFDGYIDYLPLPELTPWALEEKIRLFRRAQALRLGPPVSANEAEDPEEILLGILEWLWDVAAGPALDALNYRGPQVNGPAFPWGWPQVWWVPGGLLGQLPIHAAGYHREPTGADGRPRTVMDRVISSYAPTLRALHYSRERSNLAGSSLVPAPGQPMRSLIVAMPTTPGRPDHELRGMAEHAGLLRELLPDAEVLMQPPYPAGVDPATVSGTPTKDAVLGRLTGRVIAHFACHGVTDALDPSRSGLLLSDHATEPFTVAALASVRLDSAGLAYLSACSTALNEVAELADESIHLTSALQLAGFPHVIGTLWEIDSAVAEAVAAEFYAQLHGTSGESGWPVFAKVAATLHHIVRELRAGEPTKPFAWASYLHAGS
jgi:tetratricopeptide (TPR) repeat protein